jgi:hypothetical protein
VLLEPAENVNSLSAVGAVKSAAGGPSAESYEVPRPGAEEIPFADPLPSVPATRSSPHEDDFAAVPVIPRAGKLEAPKRSKKARLREIEEIRAEGRIHLIKIRVLLLALGLLMVAYNTYMLMHVNEDVEAFKASITSNPKIKIDPAKLEALLGSLRVALRAEGGLYFTLGVAMCGLAAFIHKAPVICTWAALGTYVAAWLIDISIIEAIFGTYAAGLAIFNLGTVVKGFIIAGLWYGTRVGHAYQEQVLQPLRELKAETDD